MCSGRNIVRRRAHQLRGDEVHTLAVLGLWVEIGVGLEDVEEGVGPGMAELIMWAPKVEWVLTVCSFCVNQVLIHAVVCVLSVEIWA